MAIAAAVEFTVEVSAAIHFGARISEAVNQSKCQKCYTTHCQKHRSLRSR